MELCNLNQSNNSVLASLSEQAKSLKMGYYRHYKGYNYKVFTVARSSETLEEYVVYQALYGDYGIWIRPLIMFCEDVIVNNQQMPRFSYIGERL